MTDEIEQRRLEQRQRARRRIIGVAVFAVLLVAIVPRILERETQPVARDIPVQVPPRDGTPVADGGPPTLPAAGRVAGGRIDAATAGESPDKTRETFADASGVRSSASDAGATPKEADVSVSTPASARAPTTAAPAAEPAPQATPRPEPAKPKAPVAETSRPRPAPVVPNKAAGTEGPARKGGILLQVGVFADAGKARQLESRLAAKGFRVSATNARSGTGPRTHVRVGPYATEAEAEKAMRRLADMGQTAIPVKH